MRNLLPLVLFFVKTVSSHDCCDYLYIHASDIVAENQQILLGIYQYEGISSESGTPYYSKGVTYFNGTDLVTTPFYFVYVANGK